MTKQPYDTRFYHNQAHGSFRSARVVVPLLIDLLHPSSVCDVGCGVGTWLGVFKEQGVEEILGIDGDYVDQAQLMIPRASFRSADLRQRVDIGRQFDLVCSLEVAEHLPENAADDFVAYLTRLAPVVLFSAAIPLQGGTQHLNEQWQSYWVAKFLQHGYTAFDYVRPHIWENDEVEWWYRQNTLLYISGKWSESKPELSRSLDSYRTKVVNLIHPKAWLTVAAYEPEYFSATLAKLPRLALAAARRRLSAS